MPGARPATSVAASAGSVAVGGDVVGSIIVNGDGNTIRLVVGPEHGDLLELVARSTAPVTRARATPVLARPQPFADHLDREGETSSVLAGVESGSPVNVYAPPGSGKTYLLVHAANRRAAERSADGVVFIDATGAGHDDLLQLLFDELYESQPPSKPLPAEITRSLRQRQATVLVDGFELRPDEAQRFFLAAGGSRFVVASRHRATWDGTPVRLGGLDAASAVTLMEREIGRALGDHELPAARAVHEALAGNPRDIRRAAAAVVDEGLTFEEVARLLAASPAPEAPLGPLAAATSKEERAVLAALSVVGPEGAGTALIAAAAGIGDVSRLLEGLRRRHLVVSASDERYQLASHGEGEGIAGVDLGAVTERAAAALLLRSVPFAGPGTILAVLRSARRHGRHAAVVGLGRAVSAALALSRMWGTWQEVLDAVLVAAREVNDRPGEAWALHQLGTRAVSIGLVAEGVMLLENAFEIRRELGDAGGAAATHQNLEVARRIASGPPTPWAAVLAALAVVAAGLVLWAFLRPDSTPPGPILSVAAAGGGAGALTSSPAGIDCTGSCTARFASGAKVTLTATAADGSVFSRWEAPGCTGDGPCSVTMDGDTSATAHFDVVARSRTLTVAKGGQGVGTIQSSPSGISCGSTCRASFAAGAEVTLTATAGDGSRFVRWEVSGCSGTESCILRLDADVSAIARFEAVAVSRTLTVVSSGQGAGAVQSSPSGISCGGACKASFADGTQVTLTAAARPGSAFVRWNVTGCSGPEPCTIIMDADRSATATFTRVWERVVKVTGTGSVTSTPAGIACASPPTTGGSCTATFPEDSIVVFTATPATGWYLLRWEGGGCSGSGLTCRVVIKPQSPLGGTPTVTATFSRSVD